MADASSSVGDYTPEMLRYVRAVCLYLATLLKDHLDDLVLVGGLVPHLLIAPEDLPPGATPHVGTKDVDIGLALHLLDDEKYRAISERLRGAGFHPDEKEETGNPILQTWRIDVEGVPKVTIDFLIGQADAKHPPSSTHKLEKDFAAYVIPGVPLAFADLVRVPLSGTTILGEKVKEPILFPVCGPGAFVVLKALAFAGKHGRGTFKDAYDLFWLIRNHPGDVEAVAARVRALLPAPLVEEALRVLEENFSEDDQIGPMRVARFVHKRPDPALQADVVAFLTRFLVLCRPGKGKP